MRAAQKQTFTLTPRVLLFTEEPQLVCTGPVVINTDDNSKEALVLVTKSFCDSTTVVLVSKRHGAIADFRWRQSNASSTVRWHQRRHVEILQHDAPLVIF